MNDIHPTAIVSDKAELGKGNTIGPYVVIEADVKLGNNNSIAAHSVIKKFTRLGHDNTLAEHVVLGGLPQDLGFTEKPTYVELGNSNTLREGVTINRATKDQGATRLGNENYLMALVHIGHDCQLGNNIIIAPSSGIGGHVHIDDRAFISGGVMVHQFGKIGSFAMLGGNSKITQDCLPFMITDGVPATVHGLNLVGLKRAGFKLASIKALKEAYQILFRTNQPLEDKLNQIRAMDNEYGQLLVDFIVESKRGFHRDKQAG